MSQSPSVVVVGSGFGGLSTACYLADAGLDVTVLEKNESLGGRASVLEADGFRFDMGPSWYLMPDVFERFFGHFDREPSDFYDLEPLDPHYRIFFKDGDTADVTSDRGEMYDLFESYEEGAGDALDEYLETSEEHYGVAMEKFIYEDRPRIRDWIDPDVMRAAPIGLQLLGTMDDYVADYFDTPKLRQIMQYTLVFLGGAPSNTPAIYNMMSHVDFNMGVYYPENGLRSVVDACVELGSELGVDYVTDAEVTEIINRREGFAVESEAGTFHAEFVVSNADYAHTERELLPEHERQYDDGYWDSHLLAVGVSPVSRRRGRRRPARTPHARLSDRLGPALRADLRRPGLARGSGLLPVCALGDRRQRRSRGTLQPVCPRPHRARTRRHRRGSDVVPRSRARRHRREHGVELRDRIVFEEQFSVSEFADRYNSAQGTALGLAHTLRQTALFRPPHRSEACPGLYYTGSYTTPGIGVPMCLISGEHTANTLIDDIA